jgi:hypothetical protein
MLFRRIRAGTRNGAAGVWATSATAVATVARTFSTATESTNLAQGRRDRGSPTPGFSVAYASLSGALSAGVLPERSCAGA